MCHRCPSTSRVSTSRSETAVRNFGSQFTRRVPRWISPSRCMATKTRITALVITGSSVKRSRDQSGVQPRRRSWPWMAPADWSRQASARRKNSSRPRVNRVSFVFASSRSTTKWVAIEA